MTYNLQRKIKFIQSPGTLKIYIPGRKRKKEK